MTHQQRKRTVQEALYCIAYGATVRDIAKAYGISKTTVHKDLTKLLPLINSDMAIDVRAVLDKNLEERHVRGGEATRRKYNR